jgi:hypothetical protein
MGAVVGCAVLLLLFTSPLWVIALKRKITRWLLRSFENRTFDHATRSMQAVAAKKAVFFPAATFVGFLLIFTIFALGSVASFMGDGGAGRNVIIAVTAAMYTLGQLALLVALYLHYSGRSSRRAKYDWLLTGFVTSGFTGGGAFALLNGTAINPAGGVLLSAIVAINLFIYWLVWIVVQWAIAAFVKSLALRHREANMYYQIQSPALFVVAMLFGPLLIAYVLLRFHLRPLMHRHPIVYVRAFRNQTAPLVFAKVVAKATRRVGVLVGLAHRLQRPSDLQTGLEVVEQADFAVSPDDAWQSWMTEVLQRAAVVVVDATIESASLDWEIDQALRAVGANRVAILSPQESARIQSGVVQFQYGPDSKSISRCRRDLRNWLRLRVGEVLPHASTVSST